MSDSRIPFKQWREEQRKQDAEWDAQHSPTPPRVTADLSGFGGGYEWTCQKMLEAGLKWLEDHPNAQPDFKALKDVYGLLLEDNDDAKSLSDAITSAVDDCTGAMHECVCRHIFQIRRLGYQGWLEELRKDDPKRIYTFNGMRSSCPMREE